jgi:hypothetical protein
VSRLEEVRNDNPAAIMPRSSTKHVAGFIRIDNRWRYEAKGHSYDPRRLIAQEIAL